MFSFPLAGNSALTAKDTVGLVHICARAHRKTGSENTYTPPRAQRADGISLLLDPGGDLARVWLGSCAHAPEQNQFRSMLLLDAVAERNALTLRSWEAL